MTLIDLRSDTVTHPTPAMREAMANAPVGDDVYGEDPTVNALQDLAAGMLGKEAGLFVASGTMGNLTSVLSHCGRGEEMILGKQAHIFRYEAGSAAAYGGVHPNTLTVHPDGTLDLDEIRHAIRPDNEHCPVTRLICLENTQGGVMGAPLPVEYVRQVGEIARAHHLKLHVDGARLFNAAAALNVSARELVEDADSVSICLSKGLCAPVGSVIVGSREFIQRAHRIRKSLGGGMRQAGILAAAGILALETMSRPERLNEDHANARALAEGLAALPFIELDMSQVRTNMFKFALTADAPISVEAFMSTLETEYGIIIRPYSVEDRSFRLVTHYYIRREDVQTVLGAVSQVLRVPAPVVAD